jgi:ribonuclease Z
MVSKIKIHFLGTSAQIPSPRRNHTSILINYKEENILVDCGEGTQIQFREAHLNPGCVTRILITHIHGDHTFGLPGLISTLNFSEYKRDLHIYGPKGIKRFLEEFLGVSEVKRNYKIIIEEIQKSGKFFESEDFYLESEKMQHGIPTNAYNFVIKDKLRIDKNKITKSKITDIEALKKLKQGKDIVFEKKKFKNKDLTYTEKGKKISFVLDTLYNDKIIPFVKDAEILICDASFSSKLNNLAKEHLHLTAEQDGIIAKKAKVKHLFLTHISQRYENNLNELIEDAKQHFEHVKVAHDLEVVEI